MSESPTALCAPGVTVVMCGRSPRRAWRCGLCISPGGAFAGCEKDSERNAPTGGLLPWHCLFVVVPQWRCGWCWCWCRTFRRATYVARPRHHVLRACSADVMDSSVNGQVFVRTAFVVPERQLFLPSLGFAALLAEAVVWCSRACAWHGPTAITSRGQQDARYACRRSLPMSHRCSAMLCVGWHRPVPLNAVARRTVVVALLLWTAIVSL